MALATISDLKSLLSVTHTDDDTLFTRIVASASSYFEKQIGRTLSVSSVTEVQDGTGGRVIVPSQYPLVSVTSLKIDGETISASTGYGVDGYYLDGDVIRLRGSFACVGEGNIELAYSAGYSTIPSDVVQAVLELSAIMYRERDRFGQQSRNDPTGSVVFYYQPPARVMQTIEAYRRTG